MSNEELVVGGTEVGSEFLTAYYILFFYDLKKHVIYSFVYYGSSLVLIM